MITISGLGLPPTFQPGDGPPPPHTPPPPRPPISPKSSILTNLTAFVRGLPPADIVPATPVDLVAPVLPTCGYGFTWNNGVCVSNGCVDGKSQCIVSDANSQTCSYDQYLAYWHQSGVQACPPVPPPAPPPTALPPDHGSPGMQVTPTPLPPPPPPPWAQPDGSEPSPGMQVTPSVPPPDTLPMVEPPSEINWWLVGAGAFGIGLLIALARR